MMNFTFKPYIGIDPILFGQSRNKVRQLLSSLGEDFYKSEDSKNPVTAFDNFGVHCYFTDLDELEFLEVFEPCSLQFENINLFLYDLELLIQKLQTISPNMEEDESGFDFPDIGLIIYSPNREKIECISLYSKNYYDE